MCIVSLPEWRYLQARRQQVLVHVHRGLHGLADWHVLHGDGRVRFGPVPERRHVLRPRVLVQLHLRARLQRVQLRDQRQRLRVVAVQERLDVHGPGCQVCLHVHTNLSTRSVHVEPFMHGDDTQSLSFTSQLYPL